MEFKCWKKCLGHLLHNEHMGVKAGDSRKSVEHLESKCRKGIPKDFKREETSELVVALTPEENMKINKRAANILSWEMFIANPNIDLPIFVSNGLQAEVTVPNRRMVSPKILHFNQFYLLFYL